MLVVVKLRHNKFGVCASNPQKVGLRQNMKSHLSIINFIFSSVYLTTGGLFISTVTLAGTPIFKYSCSS